MAAQRVVRAAGLIARRALPDCRRHNWQRTKGRRHGQGLRTRPILAASMPVRAIQKKWALRAVLFPWEIRGYMALAVLIAAMADGLAWALDIGVASWRAPPRLASCSSRCHGI